MNPTSDSSSDCEGSIVNFYCDEDETPQQRIDADNDQSDICSVFGNPDFTVILLQPSSPGLPIFSNGASLNVMLKGTGRPGDKDNYDQFTMYL